MIPSWKLFFENRRLRNERSKVRETPKERQARESREKNPPTQNTKVFLWTKADNGEYRRESFYRAENGMNLDAYGTNQKIYDAFSNEWDCCYEFGESTDEEYLHDNGVDDNDPMMFSSSVDTEFERLGPSTSKTVVLPSLAAQDRSFIVIRPAEVVFDWHDFETSRLLYDFYGFVAPLPLPAHPSSINSVDRSLLSTVVGLCRDDSDFFLSPVASFALEFLKLLNCSKTPKNTMWDIASGNRLSICGSWLFRLMQVIEFCGENGQQEKWHVFDFKDSATVPWMVALPNVVDALYVCRLVHMGGSQITDFEVARELLNHGIQFSTLLPVKPLSRSVAPALLVPVRLPEYKFTLDDYYAYEQQRAALLSDPRIARAALLRGGIVWRLAVATLSFDDVLEGPTTAATLRRQGVVIKTSDKSVDLCDDGLSQVEFNIICGLHHCLTGSLFFFLLDKFLTSYTIGQGTGYASRSWWPTDSIWQKNAQHTRWTEKSDHFFTSRLQKLQAGIAQPLNCTEWRKQIRGSNSIRHIKNVISSASHDFVKAHIGM